MKIIKKSILFVGFTLCFSTLALAAYIPNNITAGSANIVVSPTKCANGTCTIGTTDVINAQGTAASYAIVSTDMGKTVTQTRSSAMADTIAQAGTTGFESGKSFTLINYGAGTLTLTPSTSTVNGAATLVLTAQQGAYITSDGTNYIAFLGAATGGGSGTVTTTGSPSSGDIAKFSGSTSITNATVTGSGGTVVEAASPTLSGTVTVGANTGSTNQLTINTNANAGFKVVSSSNLGPLIELQATDTGGHDYSFYSSGSGNTAGWFGVFDATPVTIPFAVNGGSNSTTNLEMQLANDTALTFGSDPSFAGQSTHVAGFSYDGSGAIIDVDSGTRGNKAGSLNFTNMTATGATINMSGLASSSAAQTGTVCWTTGTGRLTVDTTTTCLLSSLRFKKDVESLDSGLAEVMKMRPVTFMYKESGGDANLKKRKVGMIAEEVNKIDTRLVAYEQDGKTPRAIMYAEYTAVLTKAIQEQQKEIEDLKEQIKKIK